MSTIHSLTNQTFNENRQSTKVGGAGMNSEVDLKIVSNWKQCSVSSEVDLLEQDFFMFTESYVHGSAQQTLRAQQHADCPKQGFKSRLQTSASTGGIRRSCSHRNTAWFSPVSSRCHVQLLK